MVIVVIVIFSIIVILTILFAIIAPLLRGPCVGGVGPCAPRKAFKDKYLPAPSVYTSITAGAGVMSEFPGIQQCLTVGHPSRRVARPSGSSTRSDGNGDTIT